MKKLIGLIGTIVVLFAIAAASTSINVEAAVANMNEEDDMASCVNNPNLGTFVWRRDCADCKLVNVNSYSSWSTCRKP